MKTTILYFSGTGNTELIARRLSGKLSVPVHSIEEKCDFHQVISEAERIILLYPIHYAVPPMFMRDFLSKHFPAFEHKEIISIATQMIVSGDGARVVEEYLPESARLIDIHQINMPNNISNMPMIPVTPDWGNRRKVRRALRKADRIAKNILAGRFKRRHASRFAIWLGNTQRPAGLRSEQSKKGNVWVTDACIRCGICVRTCPTGNFRMEKKAVPQGDCTFCTRCENRCPVNAISVLLNRPVKKKYKGPLAGK